MKRLLIVCFMISFSFALSAQETGAGIIVRFTGTEPFERETHIVGVAREDNFYQMFITSTTFAAEDEDGDVIFYDVEYGKAIAASGYDSPYNPATNEFSLKLNDGKGFDKNSKYTVVLSCGNGKYTYYLYKNNVQFDNGIATVDFSGMAGNSIEGYGN
jgi:hypothetical protein